MRLFVSRLHVQPVVGRCSVFHIRLYFVGETDGMSLVGNELILTIPTYRRANSAAGHLPADSLLGFVQ